MMPFAVRFSWRCCERRKNSGDCENGTVVVLSAGQEFKLLSKMEMGEGPVRATMAVARGEIFIRTSKQLYCIGRN